MASGDAFSFLGRVPQFRSHAWWTHHYGPPRAPKLMRAEIGERARKKVDELLQNLDIQCMPYIIQYITPSIVT